MRLEKPRWLTGRVSADVHAAPNLRGKPAASTAAIAPVSNSTGVVAGTNDSPTCSRGKCALSKTTTDSPALAR